MPPDLAEVVAAWTRLPEVVKTGIMALVKASNVDGSGWPETR
jgi:hypothetical protein